MPKRTEETYTEAYDRGLRDATLRIPARPGTYLTANQRKGYWAGIADGQERRRAEEAEEQEKADRVRDQLSRMFGS